MRLLSRVNVPFLNPAAQFAALRTDILAAVEGVLAKGHYILGPNVAAFEQEIAAFCGAKFGIGVNSGSDALTLALKALGIGPGDEVITTPFTYIAPSESIHQLGARIVFADIDPRHFTLDAADVARRITPRTKAIIPVHLFGQAAPLEALAQLGLPLVEDCAQAIGASSQGRPVAGQGTLGCLSFYPTKNLGACGDGGIYDVPGRVMELTNAIEPGNSGGPLLDGSGRVAGVVFARNTASRHGLAILVTTLTKYLAATGADTSGIWKA